jgi:hypothetical protein
VVEEEKLQMDRELLVDLVVELLEIILFQEPQQVVQQQIIQDQHNKVFLEVVLQRMFLIPQVILQHQVVVELVELVEMR